MLVWLSVLYQHNLHIFRIFWGVEANRLYSYLKSTYNALMRDLSFRFAFPGNDNKQHQCVAAYMSDFSLLGTSLQPGGPNVYPKFMTSLDHTIWFHNQFRADEWMLYEAFSPHAGKGRALLSWNYSNCVVSINVLEQFKLKCSKRVIYKVCCIQTQTSRLFKTI